MKPPKRKTKGSPNQVDMHVGHRLRVRRSLMGLSQEKLAELIGLTFQQVQKYERGMNRISAGRLFEFAKILGVPVSYFFDQFAGNSNYKPAAGVSDNEQEEFMSDDVMNRKETIDLLKAYYGIHNSEARKDFVRIMKSLGHKISETPE